VPSTLPNKLDGDPGPAQNTLGYGVVTYRKLFRSEEAFTPICRDGVCVNEKDPHRLRMAGASKLQAPSSKLQEVICGRYIDSRAASNPHITEKGGTCIADDFATPARDPKTGAIIDEPMVFLSASGEKATEGLTAIDELLFWDPTRPLCAIINAPRFYVCEDCKQVVWAMQNWTGRDGEKGAGKDFVDLVRYMALARLRHQEPGVMKTRGGGSY